MTEAKLEHAKRREQQQKKRGLEHTVEYLSEMPDEAERFGTLVYLAERFLPPRIAAAMRRVRRSD